MSADRSSRVTAPGDAPRRQIVVALFALTGFSALCLQVVWQRVISIHGGVDLFSSATVVAAFMAGLGTRKSARRRARGSLGRAALDPRVRCRKPRYRTFRLGLDRDLLRRVPGARRARPVAAGRVRVPFRAARRADDADGLVAAAAVARRRARRRRSGARREPALRREHARRRGRSRGRRLAPARQSRLRRHGAAREQPEPRRGRRRARAMAQGAGRGRGGGAPRRPAPPTSRPGASGRGSRCTRRRAPPRSRSRSSTSGSSTASCARTPTRSRTC